MITSEKFKAYLAVRNSGVTNMFDVGRVIKLTKGKLNREDCMDIMMNFVKYMHRERTIKNKSRVK